MEACTNGRIEKICFNACMSKEIDGMLQNIENQDGIDIRNGCHNIIISDITGRTGDDLIALTAIANENVGFIPGGSFRTTHVMHNDWTKRDKNIHDIIIRNVMGYSQLCYLIRLLPSNSRIWNVVIDGVVDTSPDDLEALGGLLLGDFDFYGINLPDSMRNISISNIICNRPNAILVEGWLSDSVITNVTNRKKNCPAVIVSRPNGIKNVKMSNLNAVEAEPYKEKQ